MNNGRTVNPGKRTVALTFLVFAALLTSGIGATYWAGLRTVKLNRELAARRFVIPHSEEIRSKAAGMTPAEEAEFDRAALAADKAAATGTAVFILAALLNLVFLALTYRQIAKEFRDITHRHHAEEACGKARSDSARWPMRCPTGVDRQGRRVHYLVQPALVRIHGDNAGADGRLGLAERARSGGAAQGAPMVDGHRHR